MKMIQCTNDYQLSIGYYPNVNPSYTDWTEKLNPATLDWVSVL